MTEPRRYKLTVGLLDDMHTGSGTGSGDIDALQARDHRGLPVIAQSHLKGVLLAAGEELMDHDPAAAPALRELLGRAGKGRGMLRLTNLYLTSSPETGATVVWAATARESGDRRPREDSLRMVEHVAAGSEFQAEIELSGGDNLHELLERLVRRVDRLGSDRNRGGGLVEMRVTPIQPAATVTLPAARTPRLRLRIRNLAPLCLPLTGHPGNLIRSLPFIRGQAFKGAFKAWAMAQGDQTALGALDGIAFGDCRPLPAALKSAPLNRLEVLPIPLSIQTPKPGGGESDRPWWAQTLLAPEAFDALSGTSPGSGEKPKRPGAHEYIACADPDSPWLRYAPHMSVHLRNQSADLLDRTSQRKQEPELFSVEEIAEDTRFVADLNFPDTLAAQAFLDLFEPLLAGRTWISLGRGGRPAVVEGLDFLAEPQAADPVAAGFADTWTLTLSSDLIARGKYLGFLTDLDPVALIELAGATAAEFPSHTEWKMQGFAESEPLHGFNATSGLRRAPALAIRRGSCWRLSGPGSAALAARLAKLPALGERTQEGCGRFVLDLPRTNALVKPAGTAQTPPENRQEAIFAAARRLADQLPADGPSASQLQWLRSRALGARDQQQIDACLLEVRTAPQRRPNGGRAWEKFPYQALADELSGLTSLDEKRQLISHCVQRAIARARARKED